MENDGWVPEYGERILVSNGDGWHERIFVRMAEDGYLCVKHQDEHLWPDGEYTTYNWQAGKPLVATIGSRPPCWDCCLKHLGTATVLMDEVAAYPMHKWLAVGHLVEAEAECPGARSTIRDVRLTYMAGSEVDMMGLIEEMDDERTRTPK